MTARSTLLTPERVLPEIVILDRDGASRYLRSDEPDRGPSVRCAISIGDPGEPPPEGLARVRRRLRLEFHDVTVQDAIPWLGSLFVTPSRDHARRIVRFAGQIDGKTLIHCAMGISRSTAAAYISLCTILGPGGEERALAAVLAAQPWAHPNRALVEHADRLLRRGGAMLEQLEIGIED